MNINFKSHIDSRGSLTVIEKEIPFDIKEYFISIMLIIQKEDFISIKKQDKSLFLFLEVVIL